MLTETATATPLREVITRGAAIISRARQGIAIGPARVEAELLAAHVLGIPRWRLWLETDRCLTVSAAFEAPEVLEAPEVFETMGELFLRRAAGEPLQYLTGGQEFWGLTFQVRPGVFIPRPETEGVIEAALRRYPPDTEAPALIVEIGTGSGCLAVALAHTYPRARVIATDLSPVALAVAAENARRHGVLERVTFVAGDLFEALETGETGAAQPLTAHLLVSNPPYVRTADWNRLPREIRLHEPREALDGGPDGLETIRRLLKDASRYLAPGGLLLVELGAGQASSVRRLARRYGLAVEAIERDLAGIPRVLVASPSRSTATRIEWTA